MSADQLQKRLADLKFSAEEFVKHLHEEVAQSEREHAAWEDEADGKTDDELVEHDDIEPDVIYHDEKINHIEAAIDYLDKAIDALDGALDE